MGLTELINPYTHSEVFNSALEIQQSTSLSFSLPPRVTSNGPIYNRPPSIVRPCGSSKRDRELNKRRRSTEFNSAAYVSCEFDLWGFESEGHGGFGAGGFAG